MQSVRQGHRGLYGWSCGRCKIHEGAGQETHRQSELHVQNDLRRRLGHVREHPVVYDNLFNEDFLFGCATWGESSYPHERLLDDIFDRKSSDNIDESSERLWLKITKLKGCFHGIIVGICWLRPRSTIWGSRYDDSQDDGRDDDFGVSCS